MILFFFLEVCSVDFFSLDLWRVAGRLSRLNWTSVLEEKIIVAVKSSTGLENVIEGILLSVEGVDEWGISISEWGLAEISEGGENAVEAGEFLVTDLVLNSLEDLGEENQVENNWSGKERILTDVVADEGVLTVQEDRGDILIHGLLGVSSEGDVLDNNLVVDFRGVGEENLVGGKNIVNAGLLGKLLRLELSLRGEVLSVVVSEVVVADDGLWLDSGGDEELGQGGLELGLSGLEIVTDNEDLVLLGELDDSRDEGILGRSVDVGAVLGDGGEGKDSGGGNLWVVLLDGLHQVFVGIVNSNLELAESLGVSGPEDDNLIDSVGELEVADVLSDLVQVSQLIVSGEDIVSSGLLVGGDEVWVVDGREWNDFLDVGSEFLLEVVVENLGASHRLSEVEPGDVPSVDDDVVRVHEWKNLVQGEIDLLVSVNSDLGGRGLGD